MYLSDEEYSNCFEKPSKKKGKRKRSPSPPPKKTPGKTPKGAKAKKSRQDDDDEDEVKHNVQNSIWIKKNRGLNNGNIENDLAKPWFHYLISCSKAVYKGLMPKYRFTTGRDPFCGRIDKYVT